MRRKKNAPQHRVLNRPVHLLSNHVGELGIEIGWDNRNCKMFRKKFKNPIFFSFSIEFFYLTQQKIDPNLSFRTLKLTCFLAI